MFSVFWPDVWTSWQVSLSRDVFTVCGVREHTGCLACRQLLFTLMSAYRNFPYIASCIDGVISVQQLQSYDVIWLRVVNYPVRWFILLHSTHFVLLFLRSQFLLVLITVISLWFLMSMSIVRSVWFFNFWFPHVIAFLTIFSNQS